MRVENILHRSEAGALLLLLLEQQSRMGNPVLHSWTGIKQERSRKFLRTIDHLVVLDQHADRHSLCSRADRHRALK